MADSMCFEKQSCLKVEEDWADRYRNNTQELDEWFYAAYYMDPQPQFDPTLWATPEDDEIFDVGELFQIPKKFNGDSHCSEPSQIPKKFNKNSEITCAATSSTIINKCVGGKVKELKDLSEFICITMGLGPVCESKKLIKPPIAKKVVPTAPVKKVVSVLPSMTKRDEQKVAIHGLDKKRKISHCDFRLEAKKQVFDEPIKEAKKQKTNQVVLQAVSKAKLKSKPSFKQKLMAMATRNKKHHNFQPLVY